MPFNKNYLLALQLANQSRRFKPRISKERADILRATGRDDQPPAPNVISMQSSKLLEDLRRAANS